ncbi:hypothetical protein ACEWY4_024267 [Coilia grayii]|uniref:C-type lectin domain-containing protein n=1 Tax=Coilia grayii TaxID=363190 RepID=A0ABD1J008_9TELE
MTYSNTLQIKYVNGSAYGLVEHSNSNPGLLSISGLISDLTIRLVHPYSAEICCTDSDWLACLCVLGHPSVQGSSHPGSQHKAGKTAQNPTTLKVLLGITSLCLGLTLAALGTLGHYFLEKQSQLDLLKAQHKNVTAQLSLTREKWGCTPCAELWRNHSDKCYFFSFDLMNWTESRDQCVSMGGHLVIINDQAEQIFLSSVTTESHWIGLSDHELEGRWLWVDNTPLTRASPQFWFERSYGRDEPDNWMSVDLFGQDCVSLGDGHIPTNVWFDEHCQKMKRYVCESVAASQDRYNVCK